jgi:hypothetical protein
MTFIRGTLRYFVLTVSGMFCYSIEATDLIWLSAFLLRNHIQFVCNFINLKDNLMTCRLPEFHKFHCNLFDERKTNVPWSMRILSGIIKDIIQRYFSFVFKQVGGAHVGTSVYRFSRSTDSLCFINKRTELSFSFHKWFSSMFDH